MKHSFLLGTFLALAAASSEVKAHEEVESNRCMCFQGITLCDSGDVEIERFDGLYTSIGTRLYIDRISDRYHSNYRCPGPRCDAYCYSPYYGFDQAYRVQRRLRSRIFFN